MIVQRNEQQFGMISVPWQEYTTPYAPAEALAYGTVFSGLNQPYTPVQCPQQAMNMQPTHNNMQGMQGMQKKR